MGELATAQPVAFVLTADRAISKPFYEHTLGLRYVEENPFAVVFELAGAVLRLTTVPGYKPHPHTVLGWEVPDVVATVQGLKAKGVDCKIYEGFGQDELGLWTSPDGKTKLAWFADPEGNILSVAQHI